VPDVNGSIEHGFACPKSASCFSFDAPVPGTILTQADEINAHGQIVGIHTGEDGIWHSFLISGASFTSFDFPGSTGTGAYGINSAGQIVGKYFADDGSTHGFLAEPAQKGKPQ
jgi:probable HAF family extracellular repeat protein